ncbi:MAG: hypothetical protein KAJ52_04745 [Sedimentisphaerales bacterium]|nr:hypothetical protein [Sedimentisphaerales bacterium]
MEEQSRCPYKECPLWLKQIYSEFVRRYNDDFDGKKNIPRAAFENVIKEVFDNEIIQLIKEYAEKGSNLLNPDEAKKAGKKRKLRNCFGDARKCLDHWGLSSAGGQRSVGSTKRYGSHSSLRHKRR